jgi:uncharacterized protein
MSEPFELEPDIEALDAFLLSDGAPDNGMMLSDLDGFLTGLAVGPELVPPSEWLPVVWGGEDPAFEDAVQAQAILGAIMRRYNEILAQIDEGLLAPIFMETAAGEVLAGDWAEGFMDAVMLRPDAWTRLLKSERDFPMLAPIMALCWGADGKPLLDLPEEALKHYLEAADDLIPEAALDIAEYWRAARTAPQRRPGARKPGRNDPCPCGSGKKFKKCCGLET